VLNDLISSLFKQSIDAAIAAGKLGNLKSAPESIAVELPKNPDHGDRAISIAMKLTKDAGLNSRQIAQAIVDNLDRRYFSHLDIAGPGFINLTLSYEMLEKTINNVFEEDERYGFSKSNGKKILLEYVSANPTGDLHLGHGRQAVLGSAIASLLKVAGYDVFCEFYINDAGAQIEKLGKSCYQAILFQESKIDRNDYDEENNYPLDSMLEFIHPAQYRHALDVNNLDINACADYAKKLFQEHQKKVLKDIFVEFDQWYSESENLHQGSPTKVDLIAQEMLAKDLAYELDGALWFRAKDHGDERDRVLRKADGKYTYLAADLAYHRDKFSRADYLINIWGADHHGQIPGIKGALQALGHNSEALEIVLYQLVSLAKNGVEVKMSKREGNVVTITDLVDEVGIDALRYFMVEVQANNRMVFDLELAKKQDKDNPVYYIQYAHARACSIVRNLLGEQIDINQGTLEKPILQKSEFDEWLNNAQHTTGFFENIAHKLNALESKSLRDLVLTIANYPDEIENAALNRAPYKIANYLNHLATMFHQFYSHNRVIVDDKDLMRARVIIVVATQKVLRNALKLLSISAPEKM